MTWVESSARIPANVEVADKLIGPYTARQLVILGVTGALLYAGYLTLGQSLPLPVFTALALPLAVAGFLLAVGQHDGIFLDRYPLAAVGYHRSPKNLISSADQIPAAPVWIAAKPGPTPAPLQLPAKGVDSDGLIDLGPDGVVAVAEVSTVSFALRTPDEQDALVAVFGRWPLNGSFPANDMPRPRAGGVSSTGPRADSSIQASPPASCAAVSSSAAPARPLPAVITASPCSASRVASARPPRRSDSAPRSPLSEATASSP